MQRRKRVERHSERGVIAVEFALVVPVLLVLLFGIVEFGRAYNAKVELTGAVREGVRVLALASGDPVATTLDASPGLDTTTIVVTTSGSPCAAGSPAWVQASYPFTLHIPFYGTPTIDIQAKGVMRCGG